MREASVKRTTKETDISVKLNVDGSGKSTQFELLKKEFQKRRTKHQEE